MKSREETCKDFETACLNIPGPAGTVVHFTQIIVAQMAFQTGLLFDIRDLLQQHNERDADRDWGRLRIPGSKR